jgi:DNA-directed RNA polymerase specialized sigma24 family protein
MSAFERSIPAPLLQRLRAMALRQASRADADDAVQQLLIEVWLRGQHWHEGRIVLQLRGILRNQRRADVARARRELEYVLMTCGPVDHDADARLNPP